MLPPLKIKTKLLVNPNGVVLVMEAAQQLNNLTEKGSPYQYGVNGQ